MAELQQMPPIVISREELAQFCQAWSNEKVELPKNDAAKLTSIIDSKVGYSLAKMLGDIPIVKLKSIIKNPPLLPANKNCVEVGPCRVIGGIRPQNFDVGYRPDGIRFAFDSKSLNTTESVGKNYQNMINDLGSESTTVHTRFPYAVVAFIVIIPTPCLPETQRKGLTSVLMHLTMRSSPADVHHKAEVISLVLWDPATGEIDATWPNPDSPLRIERFSKQVEEAYVSRYAGMPPHQ